MKFLLTSAFILFSNFSFSETIHYYEFKKGIITVIDNSEYKINESCYQSTCSAKQALEKKISIKKLNLKGGKNPGSVACTQVLSGQVMMLKNIETNNVSSFCLFKDGSYISNKAINQKVIF